MNKIYKFRSKLITNVLYDQESEIYSYEVFTYSRFLKLNIKCFELNRQNINHTRSYITDNGFCIYSKNDFVNKCKIMRFEANDNCNTIKSILDSKEVDKVFYFQSNDKDLFNKYSLNNLKNNLIIYFRYTDYIKILNNTNIEKVKSQSDSADPLLSWMVAFLEHFGIVRKESVPKITSEIDADDEVFIFRKCFLCKKGNKFILKAGSILNFEKIYDLKERSNQMRPYTKIRAHNMYNWVYKRIENEEIVRFQDEEFVTTKDYEFKSPAFPTMLACPTPWPYSWGLWKRKSDNKKLGEVYPKDDSYFKK